MERYGLSGQLEGKCSHDVQMQLCEQLTEWRNVAPYLLPDHYRTVRDEIDHDLRLDEKGRRRELLDRWKEIYGSDATHKALIRALLAASRMDLAELVCQKIVGQPYQTEGVWLG